MEERGAPRPLPRDDYDFAHAPAGDEFVRLALEIEIAAQRAYTAPHQPHPHRRLPAVRRLHPRRRGAAHDGLAARPGPQDLLAARTLESVAGGRTHGPTISRETVGAPSSRQIREQGLCKEEWPILGQQGPEIRVEGRAGTVLNFCANNYLGLSGHPELVAAAHRTLDEWGYGMSSVRFICGTQRLHLDLERKVADFLGLDDAILYAACFDANGGVFEPLLGAEDAILTDRLNHASIIDGVRLCKAKRFVYEHADMDDLEAKLMEAASARFRLIVTDGVFSMDGDVAPLERICDLADRHQRAGDGGRLPRHRLHGHAPGAARPSTAG